jgi:6-phosphogluconolactonase
MHHIEPSTVGHANRGTQATRECAHTMSTGWFPIQTWHWALLVGATALALAAFACGDSGTTGTPVEFVYSANSDSHDISGFELGDAGTLSAVPGSPFPAGPYPHALAVDPLKRFLYALNSVSAGGVDPNTISGFAVGKQGELTPLSGTVFAGPVDPSALAVHPSGNFLYLTSYETGLWIYTIAASGALGLRPGSPIGVGEVFARDVTVHPSGRFLYVAGTQHIVAFTIDSQGGVTEIGRSPLPAGVQTKLAMDQQGRFLFAPMSDYSLPEIDDGVRTYAIGSDGTLTSATTLSLTRANSPAQATVDPSGRFLYAAALTEGAVVGLAIDATGKLTSLTGSPFFSGVMPMAVAVAPSGRFACTVDRATNNITTYRVGTDGALTKVGTTPAGTYPQAIAIAVAQLP